MFRRANFKKPKVQKVELALASALLIDVMTTVKKDLLSTQFS